MSLSLYNLNKDQVNIMKAIAIILIVLHNFFNHITDIGVNEMFFDSDRVYRLWDKLIEYPNIWNTTLELISYYSWPAVLLFIFISGYGLAKRYLGKEKFDTKSYYIHHTTKLLALYIFAHIIYFILVSRTIDIEEFGEFIIQTIFLPFKNYNEELMFKYSGPFWYFCLVAQLYLIFPLILFGIKKYGENFLLILFPFSYLLIYIMTPLAEKVEYPIYGNIFGHLPEFTLGILLAFSPKYRITIWSFIIALGIAITANFYEIVHPLSYLALLIIILYTFYPLYANLPAKSIMYKTLVFIGKISMFMFIVNTMIREKYTLKHCANKSIEEQLIIGLIHLCIVILVSYILSIAYRMSGKTIGLIGRKLFARSGQ